MPELPEVESVKLQLQKFLIGHKVQKLEVRNKKYKIDPSKVIGAKFIGVRRFGKALVFDLSNKNSIVVHIKMTGQFIYQGPNLKKTPSYTKKVVGGVPGKHTHVIFTLDKKGILYFNDYRRFGWMEVVKTSDVADQSFIKKLGPEFLKNMTLQIFSQTVEKSKKAIKVLLMDQTKMAGVGNIYANDALWLAKINPNKLSSKLSSVEIKRLYESVESVLKEGVKRGGASELAFVTPDGGEGKYQDFTLVYARDGEKCKRCSCIIKKIKLGGRGTYYCPKCQK